jgi:hypothetical protein
LFQKFLILVTHFMEAMKLVVRCSKGESAA